MAILFSRVINFLSTTPGNKDTTFTNEQISTVVQKTLCEIPQGAGKMCVGQLYHYTLYPCKVCENRCRRKICSPGQCVRGTLFLENPVQQDRIYCAPQDQASPLYSILRILISFTSLALEGVHKGVIRLLPCDFV